MIIGECASCGTATRTVFSANSVPITRCPRCGLGQAMVADSFDPSSIYDESYFQGGQHDGYGDYRGSEATLRREFKELVEAVRRSGVDRGKLLEIGCAYGFFLDEASRHFDAAGVEIAADAVGACRARGLTVHQGPLSPEELRALGVFDAGVLLDVVEHLQDPKTTLAAVGDTIRPGGLLVLTTGDFSSALSRLTASRWRLMTPPQHLFFFTPKSIREMLSSTGFRVTKIEYPWKWVPLSLVAYQMARTARVPQRMALDAVKSINLSVPLNLFDAMRVWATKV